MNKSMTFKLSFSGIIAALSIVVMFLTSLIPTATIALPAIAGCLLVAVVFECGVKWGFCAYGVVAVLSFFLTPDREAFLIYTLFFGYYPVLFAVLERVKNKILKYFIKFVVFNIAVLLDFIIVSVLFGIPFESIEFLGDLTPYVLLLLANIVFLVFDFAFRGLIDFYFHKLHPLIKKVTKK